MMAKDDYYVVIYQLLSYLYSKLKKGEEVEARQLTHDKSDIIKINKKYWEYIIRNLYEDEFIKGIVVQKYDNDFIICNLERCEITPKGIAYLCENSTIQKAKEFFKDIKDIVPFL